MRKRVLFSLALLSAACAAPVSAQTGMTGRLSVEPYLAYGLFGDLPDVGPKLEAAPAFGGRAAFQLTPQWALYGNAQRSQPKLEGAAGADEEATVDHWSAGVEFSYVPRGGAEGMLPILLEAGVGQARYKFAGPGTGADLAVNLGLASALQLTRNLAVRYGANDFISNYDGDGVTNQIFVRVGAEVTF